jgi:xylose isomerase
MGGEHTLASLATHAVDNGVYPKPTSGRQEWLEAEVNRNLWTAR